ncbi:MAG: PP2C family protein-serine/threonine phosphatase [Egibacteraceae bacterium]
MGVENAVLWGAEHQDVAATDVRPVGDDVALGLARGWRPKPYWYLDPNEDAVAAVIGPRATLLVVADGHSGVEASHASVRAVLDHFGDDPPPADLLDVELVELYEVAERAVLEATRNEPAPRHDSRTTLVVALLAGRRLQWCSLGDSVLMVVTDEAGMQLSSDAHSFVGSHLTPRDVDALVSRGSAEVHERAWVVLASDGYTNYSPSGVSPADATSVCLRGVSAPTEAASALLELARTGGAGDNVAVAVMAPQAS